MSFKNDLSAVATVTAIVGKSITSVHTSGKLAESAAFSISKRCAMSFTMVHFAIALLRQDRSDISCVGKLYQ